MDEENFAEAEGQVFAVTQVSEVSCVEPIDIQIFWPLIGDVIGPGGRQEAHG